ncbi:MAG: metal ABC transporter permease [Parcubacteria group bacterium]|nr:metal ABC transporter permease [Parcubacteria group bacterium]
MPLIGVFAILRREALLSDALAHVILLGIALAITFKINVMVGILVFAGLAGLAIYAVKNRGNLGLDAIVGVFFTTSLALGSLLIEGEELLEAFLGDLEKITRGDVILSVILAAVIVATLIAKFREFAFISFAPDLAKVDKLNVKKYELFFVLLLSLGVAMGIQLVGTLLISALVIIPAATAKIFSFQIRAMAAWSMVFGLTTVLAGLAVVNFLGSPPGPTIILVSSAIFFLIFLLHSIFKTHS